MKKLLKVLKYIVILIVCVVLLVSCICAGIIMADKYKNQQYSLESRDKQTNFTSQLLSIRSTTEAIPPGYAYLGIYDFNTTISLPSSVPSFVVSFVSNNQFFNKMIVGTSSSGYVLRYRNDLDSNNITDITVYQNGYFTYPEYNSIFVVDYSSLSNTSVFMSFMDTNSTQVFSYSSIYEDGYSAGEETGYESGYTNGQTDGYNAGYEVGINESLGTLTGWDTIKGAFTSIFEALQIKVFGLFSLGDVIMICLVFAVVLFFLKVIRG